MKLILLSTGLGHVKRGIETWMAELATHLASKDLSVELWSGRQINLCADLRVRNLGALRRGSPLFKPFQWATCYEIEQLSVLPVTVAMLRWCRADMVYCGDPVLSWHLKEYRWLHNAKIVFMNGMRLSASWAKEFDGVHLLAPQYVESAQQEIGLGKSAHCFAVPHFTDIQIFHPPSADERRNARQRFGFKPSDVVVLNIGPVGHVSRKRLDFLAGEVAVAGEHFKLLSVGADEDGADTVRAAARDRLGDRFQQLHSVDRNRMPEIFHAADVYSLGSLAEPFSIAILEALASGLPVVHHNDAVMRWQTGDGGIVVSMTTPGEAARAFQCLRNRPRWREDIGTGARKLAETRYDPDIICNQLTEHLLQIHHSSARNEGRVR